MRYLILGAAMVATLPALPAHASQWDYYSETDPFTDEHKSDASIAMQHGGVLVLACSAEQFYGAVTVSRIDIEFGSTRDVMWRVDTEEPVSQTWINRPKGGAVVIGEDAIQLANALKKAQAKFVIRSADHTREFAVTGSTNAIGRVMNDCGVRD